MCRKYRLLGGGDNENIAPAPAFRGMVGWPPALAFSKMTRVASSHFSLIRQMTNMNSNDKGLEREAKFNLEYHQRNFSSFEDGDETQLNDARDSSSFD
jgi:hypothetical protein